MKKQKLRPALLAAFVSIFLLTALPSCYMFATPDDTHRALEENEFFAFDFVAGQYYIITADPIAVGAHSTVWAERGSGVTYEQARRIADKFDSYIRPRIVGAFGKKDFTVSHQGSDIRFDDILDFANWRVGRDDRKLTILLLDIRDGWTPDNAYIAGYFFSGDFFSEGRIPGTAHFSNGRDMIYIDTFPGLAKMPEQALLTVAHELVHLINFATSLLLGRGQMDLWIDEGLASQGEQIFLGGNIESHINWFNNDRAGTISRGNNFFVWGNHADAPNSILDDYATVYLFFRWLYLRVPEASRDRLFFNMVTSPHANYEIITSLASAINPDWDNWETLLKTWHAANFYPAHPVFGYRDDAFHRLNARHISGQQSISLYPGEGVFSLIENGLIAPAPGGANIRYAGLNPAGAISFGTETVAGTTLLTFNANTNHRHRPETGFLTGAPASAARQAEKPLAPFADAFAVGAASYILMRGGEKEISDFFSLRSKQISGER